MVFFIISNSKQYAKSTDDHDLKFLCILNPVWEKEYEII
jgi:hypothetical protein